MKYTLEELQKIMEDSCGDLDLSGTPITSLPEGLTVGGWLDISRTPITSLPKGLTVAGNLYLAGTPITSLPDRITVGGWLDLRETQITSLPEGMTVDGSINISGTPITSLPEGMTVAGSLDLAGTQITSLPKGLTVAGNLYLAGTPITSLPEGLTVGGRLDLRETQITSLPEGLTVAGDLALRGTQITNRTKFKKLQNGYYVPGRYLYADGILTHVKRKRVLHGYTYYVGKIKGQNVIYDGKNYAHCKNFKSGVEDLAFKAAKDRGAEQYHNMPVDTELTVEEAKTMYRVITGACQAGTNAFVESLGKLKDKYTIAEMIDLTRGQYGSTTFKDFWERG